MNMDYDAYQEQKEKQFEARCRRCGLCCGAADDPCEHLTPVGDGRYFCPIYSHRFGPRRTRGGRIFNCVPVREILQRDWPGNWQCAYKENPVNEIIKSAAIKEEAAWKTRSF